MVCSLTGETNDQKNRDGTAIMTLEQMAEGDTPDRDEAEFINLVLAQAGEENGDSVDHDLVLPLARSIWELSTTRTLEKPLIRVSNIHGAGDDSSVGVLEVVTDDMPFLVSSVLAQMSEFDAEVSWVCHPILAVERDPETSLRTRVVGHRIEANGLDNALPNVVTESMILVVFDRSIDASLCAAIEQRIKKVLSDVRATVVDWQPMERRVAETIGQLEAVRGLKDQDWSEEVSEACSFLTWIADAHFILMGTRDYVRDMSNGGKLSAVEGSGLGVLADPNARVLRREGQMVSSTPAIEDFLAGPLPIHITKANVRSNVHRRVYMDYVGVKLFKDGQPIGERRFVGLFTSSAYNRMPEQIPLLRRKVQLVLERTEFATNSHNYNAVANILETFPRDELFQVSVPELAETTTGIMRLFERPRARAFVRHDRFDRFVSVLVFIPRDRYTTEVRERIGTILKEQFDGRISAFYPLLGDSPLVRVHFIIGRNIGPRPQLNIVEIEAKITDAVRSWGDSLRGALVAKHGEAQGRQLLSRYRDAFSVPYREAFSAEEAVEDIAKIDLLQPLPQTGVRVYRAPGDKASTLRIKIYRWSELIGLSQSLPLFENMGLCVETEYSYQVKPLDAPGGEAVWVHDFVMTHPRGEAFDFSAVKILIETAFPVLWRGEAEDDAFNKLIVEAALTWREIAMFRAVAKYLIQTGSALSQTYMEETLAAYPQLVRLFLRYFQLRFDPAMSGSISERIAESEELQADILKEMEGVQSLDQDRILRHFLDVLKNTLRTNYYQVTDIGQSRPTIAFKLDSQSLDLLPLPRPHVEVFVYSPRVEGVHLRFGPVARGGLRWSDRREDFRTEILGLVKAQYVKNSVIVPVGAKGGFVPKCLPTGSREEVQAEGIACYRLFISALLELTDNLQNDKPEAPPLRPGDTVIFDAPDPYLVVAADKGTATFSDIANELAVDHGFWLGDAFASGGSNGYDHKAMGITAKGGWEAVKRHFREMGTDIQTTPFSAIGVGDMSGDVFGNGMLLSRATKLVAAFDHRDIFLDPTPDPETSYKERERLFNLPRSSWSDYNKDLITKGGGVFSRSLKSIPLSREIQELLGTNEPSLPPHKLISTILKAPVDLLWFGGIGTYIKASDERHVEAGDAANDIVRVNAEDLRIKVIGEGANLGVTQKARIEYASAGGRINTDAIDNAAGVDCSDHEVNIKILLDTAAAQGHLSEDERNELLAEMTEDVSALVLRNNYNQTLAVSLAEDTTADDVDAHGRFIWALEREGRLNRTVEFLPSEDEMAERRAAGRGLTRPEISVLIAYSKIWLFDQIMDSDIPDESRLESILIDYFPAVLGERFKSQLLGHRLRREIIATELANEIVNIGGLTFMSRLIDITGSSVVSVVRAYIIARELFEVSRQCKLIDSLDSKLNTELQNRLYGDLRSLLRRHVAWMARRVEHETDGIDGLANRFGTGLATLKNALPEVETGFTRSIIDSTESDLLESGADESIAKPAALFAGLWSALDIVDIAGRCSTPVLDAFKSHEDISDALVLAPLLDAGMQLSADDHWERLAIRRMVEDLQQQHAALTVHVLKSHGQAEAWLTGMAPQIDRIRHAVDELTSSGNLSAAKLALAVGHIRDLAMQAAG